MGCDIHLYVERRENGVWKTADSWKTEDDQQVVPIKDDFYHDRNYALFGILAGVRNYLDASPIAAGRGIPEDACPEVVVAYRQWDCDGHSHSHMTLAELFEYDWTQTREAHGLISAAEYRIWQGWHRSEGLNPSVFIPLGNRREVSEDEMKQILKDNQGKGHLELDAIPVAVKVAYQIPFYGYAPAFWGETVPRLLRLGKPEDVRLVFWFDN